MQSKPSSSAADTSLKIDGFGEFALDEVNRADSWANSLFRVLNKTKNEFGYTGTLAKLNRLTFQTIFYVGHCRVLENRAQSNFPCSSKKCPHFLRLELNPLWRMVCCIQKFCQQTWRDIWDCGSSRKGSGANYSEPSIDILGSIKNRVFLCWLNDCLLLHKDSALWDWKREQASALLT
jgi:hypothetical protein